MKRTSIFAFLALWAGCFAAAQRSGPSFDPPPEGGASQAVAPVAHAGGGGTGPFSRFALGAGVSPLGINLMGATNLSHNLDLRLNGNVFSYSISNFSTNGFNINANLDLASAGAAIDYYPFGHGLRFSPGVLFYNGNQAGGTATAIGGTSFTLNGTNYFSSTQDPVKGTASVNLHSQNPAFTITAGYGSIVSRKSNRFTFPVEVGVALIGAPKAKMNLTGFACDATLQNCLDVATNAQIQSNLQAQLGKYNKDLDPLKTYPILSLGVAYSFSAH